MLPPEQNLAHKNQKTQKHTTTNISISNRHAAKAPQGTKNYGNNENGIKNTPVPNKEESESTEDEDNPPNIIQADTSAG